MSAAAIETLGAASGFTFGVITTKLCDFLWPDGVSPETINEINTTLARLFAVYGAIISDILTTDRFFNEALLDHPHIENMHTMRIYLGIDLRAIIFCYLVAFRGWKIGANLKKRFDIIYAIIALRFSPFFQC